MQNEMNLVKQIAESAKAGDYFITTAESCTGGLLGHLITNLPGSSNFYLGGQITYCNDAKCQWLCVPQEMLESAGAVSKETVLAMASGIRGTFSTSLDISRIIGISISGIAGPTGGSPEKPIGTVWIGISMAGDENAYHFRFSGTREEIKQQSAYKALEIILERLSAK